MKTQKQYFLHNMRSAYFLFNRRIPRERERERETVQDGERDRDREKRETAREM